MIIPTPPPTDDYGLTPHDRMRIRETAVLAAGRAMAGTSYRLTGSNEMNMIIKRIASKMEQFILNGE